MIRITLFWFIITYIYIDMSQAPGSRGRHGSPVSADHPWEAPAPHGEEESPAVFFGK